MISNRARLRRSRFSVSSMPAHSTIAFAAIGDHARLPARFFACLHASDSAQLCG
jgi:hypothetical protein